jgi:hypothetical protein
MLDKPTQLVYNIRKDMAGVQHLYDTYVLDLTKIGRNRPFINEGIKGTVGFIYEYCHAVKNLCDNAEVFYPILAGGALRDLVYNQSPKDFDFFFPCASEEEAYETIDNLTHHLGPDGYAEGGPNEDYEDEGADFEGVYGVLNLVGHLEGIQLIVGAWPKSDNFFDRFDLSICQAEMNIETYDVTFSEAFMETLVTQEITRFTETEYSRARHDRIAQKLRLNPRKETECSPAQSAHQATLTTYSRMDGDIVFLADATSLRLMQCAETLLTAPKEFEFLGVKWKTIDP